MDESAIAWKQGFFGPQTAHAVATLQHHHQLGGRRGVMDEQVASFLAEKLAGTFTESAAVPAPDAPGAPGAPEEAEEEEVASGEAQVAKAILTGRSLIVPAAEMPGVQPQLQPKLERLKRGEDASEVQPEPEPTAPEPWAAKLEQLGQMGFLNGSVLVPLLDRHNGSIIAVVAELLGQ
jgi:hypothetical protein